MSLMSSLVVAFVLFALIAICAIGMALTLMSPKRTADPELNAGDGEGVKKPALRGPDIQHT